MLRLFAPPFTTCFLPAELPIPDGPFMWLVWEDRDMRWAAAVAVQSGAIVDERNIWQSHHRAPEALAGLVLGMRVLGLTLQGQGQLFQLSQWPKATLHRIARVSPQQIQRWAIRIQYETGHREGTKPEHLWPFRPLRDRVAP